MLWQTIDSESSVDAQDGDYTPPSEHLTALQLDVPGSSVPTSDVDSRHTSQSSSKRKASDTTEGDLQRQGMWGLKPRDLKEYRGKNLREHKNYVCNCETVFHLQPDWFLVPDQCILWAQQYLMKEPKDAYYREVNSKGLISTWKNYKWFFLDLIENPMNHQISTAQNYQDAAQGATQSVQSFTTYLDTLEAELQPYDEVQRQDHLLTRLRPDLRWAIIAYPEVPDNQQDLIALTSRVELNMRDKGASSHHSHKDCGSNVHISPKKQERKLSKLAYNPWNDGQTALKFQRDTSNSNPSWKKPNPDTHTCYSCGQKGHLSLVCPQCATSVNALSIDKKNPKNGKTQP